VKKLYHLLERAGELGSPDEGAPVVRDCKLIGLESSRGRRYTPEALKAAVALYEGCPVFLDHPDESNDKPRSIRDKFGWFENVRWADGQGLRGDFRYNPRHSFAPTFEGWVKTNPGQVAFSHNAFTDPRKNHKDPDGTTVITQIAEVQSVDLVSRGATTQGLFEGHQMPTMTDPVAGDGVRKDITEGDDMLDAGAGGGGYAEHCANMVKAIMTDGSLDKAAKRKKLLKCLDLLDEEGGGAKVEEGEEEIAKGKGEEEKVKDESDETWTAKADEAALRAAKDPALKPLVEGYDRLKTDRRLRILEGRCRDLCIDAKLPLVSITDVFVQQLVEARDDKARRALIEDRRSLVGAARKPVSQPPAPRNGGKALTADDILAGARD
jgi:hypothetical protein